MEHASGARFCRWRDYEVLGRIRVGGMAELFRAVTIRAEQAIEVVLKRARPEFVDDAQLTRMFMREAELGTRMVHPNLVRVLDHGPSESGYVQAIEYVDGCDLLRVIRRLGPVRWEFAALIAYQLAAGLGFMHQLVDETGQSLRVIHRDISPANVMIDRSGTIKLLDFGIAKPLTDDGELTDAGQLKGKAGYMAPEQLEGAPLDERVDQYALGVVFYEMLVGRRLFDSRLSLATHCRLRRNAVHAPSWILHGLPRPVDELVLRLLAFDPADRFADCFEVCRALNRISRATSCRNADLAKLLERHGAYAADDHDDTVPIAL